MAARFKRNIQHQIMDTIMAITKALEIRHHALRNPDK